MNLDKSEFVPTLPMIYDKIWENYSYLAKINPAQIHRRRMLKAYLKKLKINPRKIMDIGCGTGELLFELAQLYPQAELLGCDISNESGKLISSLIPRCKFFLIDVEKTNNFELNDSIDLITCSEVLEHCSTPNNVLKNTYKWLKPGGMLFVTVPSGNMTQFDKSIGHIKHYTSLDLRSMIESEGFTNISIEYWGAPFHSLFRKFIEIGSREIMLNRKQEPTKYTPFIWLFFKTFNILFYMNFFKNRGHQIFAWGIKSRKNGIF